MPAKSLRLGPLLIPDPYFADFARGCIDGDGSITTYTDRYNTFKSDKYVYRRLFVRLVSASLPFLQWFHERCRSLLGAHGVIFARKRLPGHSQLWSLKFGKK